MELSTLKPATKKRSDYIDYLKATAIILVVLGHSFSYMIDRAHFSSTDLDTLQTLIYSVHVPLFFVVGGGLCHSQPIKNFLNKKINRLLIPFFFFSFLKVLYVNVVNSSFAHATTLSGQLYDAFILGKLYWFPYVLFLCYILAPLFWKLSSKANAVICLFCLLGSVIQPIFPTLTGSGWFGILLLPKWLGLFLLGYIIAQNKIMFSNFGKHELMLSIVSLLLIAFAFHIPTFNASVGVAKFYAFSISGMVILSVVLKWVKEGSNILRLIAKYSLQIMFMDSFFKVVLFIIVMKTKFALNASAAFVIALINLALCVIACKILEKHKVTARLVGL